MTRILIATRNQGKAAEFADMLARLSLETVTLAEWAGLAEPEETGRTFMENACLKALYYARMTGEICLADDSGLEVAALSGAPGVFSARYAGQGAGDQANNRLLLERMAAKEQRACRFVCALAVAGRDKIILTAEGIVDGELLYAERGDGGFGYDPLFFCPELGKTLAEAGMEEKNAVSHRGRALNALFKLWAEEQC